MDAIWVTIEAKGETATAIYAEQNICLMSTCIIAKGMNSTAIHGSNLVDLICCEVVSDGAAIVSDVEEIVLNGCRVTPMPVNAKVTEREAVPGSRILENGFCVPEGSNIEDFLSSYIISEYYLLDTKRQASALSSIFFKSWNNFPDEPFVQGDYSIIFQPDDLPDWCPVTFDAFEVPFHVVSENQPHIEFAKRPGPESVMVKFYSEIMDAEELTLWYSKDDGKTWLDFEELPTADVYTFGSDG